MVSRYLYLFLVSVLHAQIMVVGALVRYFLYYPVHYCALVLQPSIWFARANLHSYQLPILRRSVGGPLYVLCGCRPWCH